MYNRRIQIAESQFNKDSEQSTPEFSIQQWLCQKRSHCIQIKWIRNYSIYIRKCRTILSIISRTTWKYGCGMLIRIYLNPKEMSNCEPACNRLTVIAWSKVFILRSISALGTPRKVFLPRFPRVAVLTDGLMLTIFGSLALSSPLIDHFTNIHPTTALIHNPRSHSISRRHIARVRWTKTTRNHLENQTVDSTLITWKGDAIHGCQPSCSKGGGSSAARQWPANASAGKWSS